VGKRIRMANFGRKCKGDCAPNSFPRVLSENALTGGPCLVERLRTTRIRNAIGAGMRLLETRNRARNRAEIADATNHHATRQEPRVTVVPARTLVPRTSATVDIGGFAGFTPIQSRGERPSPTEGLTSLAGESWCRVNFLPFVRRSPDMGISHRRTRHPRAKRLHGSCSPSLGGSCSFVAFPAVLL
jgi:hypothetical protein